MHAAPCHGQYFVCEIGKEETLKFILKGCAVPRASRFVYERVGKRASWVTAIVNLTNA